MSQRDRRFCRRPKLYQRRSPALVGIVLCAALLSSAIAHAEGEVKPARAALDQWIEHVNDASDDELKSFLELNFTAAFQQRVPLDRALAFHRQIKGYGRLEVHQIRLSEENWLTALLRSSDGSWFEAELEIERESTRISGLLLVPASPPKQLEELRESARQEDSAKREVIEWSSLNQLAQHLVESAGLPGVAIAWIRPGEDPTVGVAGVRSKDADDPVRAGDLFHIGSITKSVTSTALARLVERDQLSWQATLEELFPSATMNDAYKEVELQTVVRHIARLPQHLTFDGEEMGRLNGLPGSATEQRAAYVKEILQLEPIAKGFHYSNAGYALAGHVGEIVAKSSWEQMMQDEVFSPLELSSCGIGWPATEARPNQPRGHFGDGESMRAQGLDEYQLGAFMGPAGNIHCSVSDLARYGLAHLDGLQGKDGFLKADSIAELHRIGSEGAPYAAGWGVDPESGQHRHNGSAGTFFSYLVVDPEANAVVAFLTNAGPTVGQPAAQTAVSEVIGRLGQ